MPIEGIVDHPEFIAMPAAGAGILFRMCLHFWSTNCRPLPIADHELRAVARAHEPTWRRWRLAVLKVFEDVRPELEAYFKAREMKMTTLINMAVKGGQASAGSVVRFKRRKSVSKLDQELATGQVIPQTRTLRREGPGAPLPEEKAGRVRFVERV